MSVPTQAVGDNITEVTQLLQSIEQQRRYIMSQKDTMDSATYQDHLRHLQERELCCKRDLQLLLPHQMKSENMLENRLEDLAAQKVAIEFQRQKIDDEICQQLKDQTSKVNILTKEVEELKIKLYNISQSKISQDQYQKLKEEKEQLHHQVLNYERLNQEKENKIKKLRTQMLNRNCQYQMSKAPHGIAVIISNYEFYPNTSASKLLPNIRGTKKDIGNLYAIWKHLQYDVRVLRNLTASELKCQLREVALQSHENYDSFVCCILSHGYLDGVYGTDGELVKINDIAGLFKCDCTLYDKPKLFFIYTCCEHLASNGTTVAASKYEAGGNIKNPSHSLPNEADFFFNCCINTSWKSRSKYISIFNEVVTRYATREHLLNLLAIIDYKMHETFTVNGHQLLYHTTVDVTPLHQEVWFFKS